MRCRRFQRLIHLYRSGELSEQEAADLVNHVRTCSRCAAVTGQNTRSDGIIQRLRQGQPRLDKPEELVDAVLQAIGRSSPASGTIPRREPASWIPNPVLSPMFRIALTGMAFAAVGLLTFQWVTILSDVQLLESKIATHIKVSRGPDVAYMVSDEASGGNVALGELNHLVAPGAVRLEGGSFVVLEKTLRQFAVAMPAGPADALRLASAFGGDPRKVAAMVRYLERHATPTLIF